MERIPAVEESYTRFKRSTTGAVSIGRGQTYTYTAPHAPLKVTITPTYDVCERCGHGIRRGNLRTEGS